MGHHIVNRGQKSCRLLPFGDEFAKPLLDIWFRRRVDFDFRALRRIGRPFHLQASPSGCGLNRPGHSQTLLPLLQSSWIS